MAVERGHERPHLDARRRRERLGIDPRTGDDDHPQAVHEAAGLRPGSDDAPEQRLADAGPTDGDDHHSLVLVEAELPAQLLAALDQRRGVEAGDVAAELVVALGPVADPGEVRPEVVRHDVVGVADEHSPVADAREALDLLDHLRVVVGGQECLAVAAVSHRQPADEVCQPRERRVLDLGVLVQVVVELPGLVADPEVVALLAHDVVEHHEVGDQDLVHAPDGLERVEVVFGRLGRDVRRF